MCVSKCKYFHLVLLFTTTFHFRGKHFTTIFIWQLKLLCREHFHIFNKQNKRYCNTLNCFTKHKVVAPPYFLVQVKDLSTSPTLVYFGTLLAYFWLCDSFYDLQIKKIHEKSCNIKILILNLLTLLSTFTSSMWVLLPAITCFHIHNLNAGILVPNGCFYHVVLLLHLSKWPKCFFTSCVVHVAYNIVLAAI